MQLRHGVLAAVLLAGCAPSTQLVNTWKDPSAGRPVQEGPDGLRL